MADFFHNPVLVFEAVEWLQVKRDGLIVDMTLGGGGYSRAILERLGEKGVLVAFDRDEDAIRASEEAFFGDPRVHIHRAEFARAGDYLDLYSPKGHDGAVFDLGVSSHQLDKPERGFSFQQDGPLDMRMDATSCRPSAAELLNTAPQGELVRIFRDFGEEKKAYPLALAVIERRKQQPFSSTFQFSQLVTQVIGYPRLRPGQSYKHPATRSFQALRIAVNDELGQLAAGLKAAVDRAKSGARVAVVAYHSLEDRIVKNFFRDASGRCHCPRHLPVCVCGAKQVVKVLTPRPIRPGEQEVKDNRRARSALLRVAEKI